MGRTVRDHRLESRAAREKLAPRSEPYWRTINQGAHLGYYRGARVAKWVARWRSPGATGGYCKTTLGEADDFTDADGDRVLSYRDAQDAARMWFDEQARGGTKPQLPFTIGDALDEYLKGFTGKDVQSAKYRIEALIRPALGHIEVAQLKRKQVRDWHRERAAASIRLRTRKGASEQNERAFDDSDPDAVRKRRATANRDLTVLKAALNRAADDREGLPVDEWRSVKPFPDVEVARRRYLSDDEARRIVNAMSPDFRPITQASLLTGGRYTELRRARAGDFDRESRTLWLAETKSAKPRPVYLDEDGTALLEQQSAGKTSEALLFPRPDGRSWTASQQNRPMAEACRKAKILPRATFHDLRRSYGARMARQGVPMAVIAEALGHADERITRKHYAHLSPSYVADTVRGAVSGLGIVSPGNVARLPVKERA
ncbi:site-specific integrase [Sphingomonas sp. MMSM20]|uniref:tyrosine-type recombinase/integrase n=1 Tax=Sphingomonas lycopersici TaxID=2951807 RepID=UPI00223798DB|nr:site-specific integrase [Sphingomonas lycopersici]MCW6529719.1 site-specific integrase [Sphingomonas lycopersici]